MDDVDLGVGLSVTSLVMALAQDNPDQYKGAYAKAAGRLKRVIIDGEYAADYLYYKVPCPWIQVKLMRLLQYFPPSGASSPGLFPGFLPGSMGNIGLSNGTQRIAMSVG